MITRVTVSGIKPKALAERLSAAGINATCWKVWGTAVKWGVEAGCTFETTNEWEGVRKHVLGLLDDTDQEAAYVVQNGRTAMLLFMDGGAIPIPLT